MIMMGNIDIELFKDTMKRIMVKNFENDGYLTPVVFFYTNGAPIIKMIPPELLSTPNGKKQLSEYIKAECIKSHAYGAGIIIEASGTRLNIEENTKLIDEIQNGNISINDLDNKEDYILMLFSTPEKEQVFSYVVDIENKKIIEEMGGENAERIGGTFSNLFQFIKN